MPNKPARGPTHPTSRISSRSPRSCSNMAGPRKRRSPLCCTMRSRIRAGRRRSKRFDAAMASGSPGSSPRAPIPINRRNRPGGNGKRRTSSGCGRSRTRCGWWLRLTSSTTRGDLLSSYRVQGEDLWSHFTGGRDGTLWYYRAVVGRAGRRREARGGSVASHHRRDRSHARRVAAGEWPNRSLTAAATNLS